MSYDVERLRRERRGARLTIAAVRSARHARVVPWPAVAVAALAGALALVVASGDLRFLQADGYKALYDGRWIARHGVPQVNVLSAVRHGRRWVDEQWAGELFLYEVWRVGGDALVACVAGVAISAPYVVLAGLLRRRHLAIGWTFALCGYALIGTVTWNYVRAQDLAMPLFAVLVYVCLTDLERSHPGRRLLLIPPTLVLWANGHGSVVLGAALAVLYLSYRAVASWRGGSRRSAAACAALALLAALAPLATPYGLGVLHYYVEFIGNPAQRLLSAEGRSPAFPGGAFFATYVPLGLVAVLAVRALVIRRNAPVLLLVACAVTGIAASRRIGNLPWHTYVTALLIAELVPRRRRPARLPWVYAGTAAIAGLAATVALVGLATRSTSAFEANTPLRETTTAARLARAHPCWRILADNADAAALEWHDPWLAPRIAYDARSEIYSPAELLRWATFQLGRGADWSATTRGYALLLGASDYRPALVRRLSTLRAGQPVARDALGVAVENPTGGRSVCR